MGHEAREHARSSASARGLLAAVLGVLAWAAVSPAEAIEYKGKWLLGVRGGQYVHADKEGGGFRLAGELFGTRDERTVNLSDSLVPTFTLGYGIHAWAGEKRWQNVQLTLELEVSRWTSQLGSETAWMDDNASTRVVLPDVSTRGQDGDEEAKSLTVGDVTLTPIFLNALLHWGPPKADFYVGLGAGMVLAEASEDAEYREFVGDFDGTDDLLVDDVLAVNLKVGSSVRLTRSGHWYLFFEGQFFTTQLLGAQQQASWAGVNAFFGTRSYDTDGDGSPDVHGVPAEFRLIDPGKVRLDGAIFGLGLRYRFGGGSKE